MGGQPRRGSRSGKAPATSNGRRGAAMDSEGELREGEVAVEVPRARDAGLIFIGRIRTPWTSREMTPRQGRHDGPVCRLEVFEPWGAALKSVDFYSNLEVIY